MSIYNVFLVVKIIKLTTLLQPLNGSSPNSINKFKPTVFEFFFHKYTY